MAGREVKDRECCKENFLFSNVHSWQLYSPEYRTSRGFNIFYLVWRVVSALFVFASIVYLAEKNCCSEEKPGLKWLIFLTNITFVFFTSNQIWSAAVSCYVYAKTSAFNTKVDWPLTWYLKLNWIGYSLTQPLALTVTVLFWGLVYRNGMPIIYETIVPHGGHSLLTLLLDIWITAMPVRALHVYLQIGFCLIYLIFTVIYDFTGGTNLNGDGFIYQILDWDNGASWPVIYSLICLVAMTLVYYFLFGLYKLRQTLYFKCSLSSTNSVEPSDSDYQYQKA